MNEAVGLFLYYGSALLPLGYLVATLFRGRHRRGLLIAFSLHLLASFAVVAFMYWCRSAGYREWYWAMTYNIPVNGLFAIGYVGILCRSRAQAHPGRNKQHQHDEPSDLNRNTEPVTAAGCSEPSSLEFMVHLNAAPSSR